jgi:hypothetical protein
MPKETSDKRRRESKRERLVVDAEGHRRKLEARKSASAQTVGYHAERFYNRDE